MVKAILFLLAYAVASKAVAQSCARSDGPAFLQAKQSLLAKGANVAAAFEASYSCPSTCAWCSARGDQRDVVVTSNVEYGEADNAAEGELQKLLMDIYELPNQADARPVMIVIHGGGFQPSYTKGSGWAPSFAKLFASYGFWAMSIDYRSYGGSSASRDAIKVATQDARAAVRYVVKNAAALRVDPHKIALIGCSAGGITTASVMMNNFGDQPSNVGYPSNVTAGISLSGGSYSWNRKGNDESVPPYMAIHNEVDELVPYSTALNTKNYLDGRGTVNELITIPGTGHCPNIISGSDSKVEEMMGFLATHLNLPGASCPPGSGSPTPLPSPVPAPSPPVADCSQCREPACKQSSFFSSTWVDGQCVGRCMPFNGDVFCVPSSSPVGLDCSGCAAITVTTTTSRIAITTTMTTTAATTTTTTVTTTATASTTITETATMATTSSTPASTTTTISTTTKTSTTITTTAMTTTTTTTIATSAITTTMTSTTLLTSSTATPSSTTSTTASFEAVDGGRGRVCRGANVNDNSGSYYSLMSVASLDACKEECLSLPSCKGIEFGPRGRCELWVRPAGIETSRALNGYTCLRRTGVTQVRSGEFQNVDGGVDRVCRGATASDNAASYFYVQNFGPNSLEVCKQACRSDLTCRGVEYNKSGRCEIWTREGGIQASRDVAGYTCLRFEAVP